MIFAASGSEKMVIALVLLLAFAVAVGVAFVEVINWRLDVLYGPYLGRDEQKRRENDK
jgi:LPS O-antigen subunit length determinant protein (WzzB/FepE family)